jgi:hypothetical protein
MWFLVNSFLTVHSPREVATSWHEVEMGEGDVGHHLLPSFPCFLNIKQGKGGRV